MAALCIDNILQLTDIVAHVVDMEYLMHVDSVILKSMTQLVSQSSRVAGSPMVLKSGVSFT